MASWKLEFGRSRKLSLDGCASPCRLVVPRSALAVGRIAWQVRNSDLNFFSSTVHPPLVISSSWRTMCAKRVIFLADEMIWHYNPELVVLCWRAEALLCSLVYQFSLQTPLFDCTIFIQRNSWLCS
jgi:hypothetical protein